ncbi:protein FAR1-RELATED SEQUENCE 5-like [Gossypium australe]|uniref:Protein FAR1-RELATED SEQUENCE 5-like n=1 Tax=Gossypium australe TaxID=47621 RepID=A0A5B6WQU1_9ROSI|nr:protein FAR1-RELATED SEQUENCE 5-like [Gossypium australe]
MAREGNDLGLNDHGLNDKPNGGDINPPIPRIGRPYIQALQFEMKSVTVGQFRGLPTEDPRLHLRLFLEACVPEDALRLKLFPYSLRDHARAWLNALPSGTVASWSDLCQRFLLQYNPKNMNANLRTDITSF